MKQKNKQKIILITLLVQFILFVLFYYIIVWKAPVPPNAEYGIELSFVSASSTDQQNATSEDISSNASNDSPTYPKNNDSAIPDGEDTNKSTESEEEQQKEPDTQSENNDIISEETDKQKNDNQASDENQEEETFSLDNRAIYGSNTPSKNPSKTVNGASLALAGWNWDFIPKPHDNSKETGKIMYEIVVDQDGYLIKIETISSTLSPAVAQKYRQALEKLTFSKTANYQTAPYSTGTVTFLISAK